MTAFAIPRRTLLALAGAALAARPAFPIDPGVAKGGYRGDEGDFDVSHAVGLAIDNAEGHNDDVRMRLVVSDVEVTPSALCGISFPPVWGMARAGKVKGLLLEFDPANREKLVATVLAKPEPGYSLATISISRTEGVWTRLESNATRISGALSEDASDHIRLTFSAPVFTNPVVQDLTGPAVQASEPVKALLARAAALQRGDLAAARALSTETAAAAFDNTDAEFQKLLKRELPGLIQRVKTAQRVVIRRETAALLIDKGSWMSTTLVDGAWKCAD